MIRSGVVSHLSQFGAKPDQSGQVSKPGVNRQKPTLDKPRIQVKLDPISGCGQCASQGGCGITLMPSALPPLYVDCEQGCDTPVCEGDRVSVRIAEPDLHWLRLVFLAYGLPTMGMIIGAVVGYWVATVLDVPAYRETASLVGFCAGLTGGLIAWDRSEKSVRKGPCANLQADSATIVGVEPHSGDVI